MKPVLSVESLGKSYKHYASQGHRILNWLGWHIHPDNEHWVLRDISFSLNAGEAMGVIGSNGAGKSTLLKLITGVIPPSEGTLNINGRVSAILELGLGFNGELTGRTNAEHGLSLLGLSSLEIQQLMPWVEEFSDIGEYFEQPMRTYSSGMQMRIAFAVATAQRPELLIVDEALAVGDIYFQQKSFQRIRTFIEQGSALLFVTHSLGQVYSLCQRAILIDQGHLLLDASPREVIDLFQSRLSLQHDGRETNPEDPPSVNIDSQQAVIEHVEFRVQDTVVESVSSNTDVDLAIKIRFNENFEDPHIGFRLRNRFGEPVFMTNTYCLRQAIGSVHAGNVIEVIFTLSMVIKPDNYTLTIGLANRGIGDCAFEQEGILRAIDVTSLLVTRNFDDPNWDGQAYLSPRVTIRQLPG